MEKFLRIDEAENYNTQNQNYSAQVEKYTNVAKKFFEVISFLKFILIQSKQPANEGGEEGEDAGAAADLAPTGFVPDLLNDVKVY